MAQLIVGSLWPSGKASEREIKRFHIRFLLGTVNFLLLSNARDKTNEHLHNRSNVAYLLFVLLFFSCTS